jgi:hypothetical protein
VRPAPILRSLALATLSLPALACDGGAKAAEEDAVAEVGRLAAVVKDDVAQVRNGLPAGAAKLGSSLDADTLASPSGLQRAVAAARASSKDLELAKSTFFSLTDAAGTVIRSEIDPDLLAGKSVTGAFPSLKKALEPGSGVVEAFGEMKEMRGAKTGPDLAWVAAHPVKDDKGQVKGAFVTGWSLRAFAYHLDQVAKRNALEAAKARGKKNPALEYVFVIKGKTAYGTPTAPDVNAQALEKLDLVEKTKAGLYRGNVEITGRVFGVAAQRTPELGDEAALAVLATEY